MKIDGTLGVIGAMDSEIKHILAFFEKYETVDLYGLRFYVSQVNGRTVVLVKCGVGKVNASRCAQLLIDRFGVKALINTGIAGGVSPEADVADVVIATKLCQHDFDITAFGHVKGYLSTGEDGSEPTWFTADEDLCSALELAAKDIVPENKIKRGVIASGDQFIALSEQKKEICGPFGAFAAEMEGAAVAQTAQYSGVPFAVLRVLSDRADGSAAESYEKFELETARLSSEIVKKFIG
ncbi:MAG: 5'-methylthioadenosine/adenosylhomocysteine nucleosidase [Clostridia bacterium]|nr:5'-methylthioadenosine/adenosylhomocysteine nucleosidase [Clostridia bacterium]